jgi:hypothetical protein
MERPIPLEAPVTSAMRPERSKEVSFLVFILFFSW